MLLMEEAERIACEEHGSSKIAVISGKNIITVTLPFCCIGKILQSDIFLKRHFRNKCISEASNPNQ